MALSYLTNIKLLLEPISTKIVTSYGDIKTVGLDLLEEIQKSKLGYFVNMPWLLESEGRVLSIYVSATCSIDLFTVPLNGVYFCLLMYNAGEVNISGFWFVMNRLA